MSIWSLTGSVSISFIVLSLALIKPSFNLACVIRSADPTYKSVLKFLLSISLFASLKDDVLINLTSSALILAKS